VDRIRIFTHLRSWMIEMYQMCPGIAPSLTIKDPWTKNTEKEVSEDIRTKPNTIVIEAVAWIIKYLVMLLLGDLMENKIDKNKIVLISIINHIFRSELLDKAVVTEKISKEYM